VGSGLHRRKRLKKEDKNFLLNLLIVQKGVAAPLKRRTSIECDQRATREWRVWISEIEISQPEASCHQQICKSHRAKAISRLPALF
jgi:hypothetical protein